MAKFVLTTQINVAVNKTQLGQAARDIRAGLAGISIKVAIEPNKGSLTNLKTAINTKIQSGTYRVAVIPNKTALRNLKKEVGAATSKISQVVTVGIDPKSQKAIQNLGRSTKKVAKEAALAGSAIEKFGKDSALAIRRFAAFTFATSIVFGFIAAIRQGISAALDFEREMIRVSQVTGVASGALGKLKNEITLLSTSFGVSSTELARTARILSQTGLSAKDVTTALRTLAKTELAPTFGDINKTAEASIAILRQFEQGAEGLEKQLSAVNAVAGKFAVESDDIASSIRRTGAVFKAAGGNLNELISLFTAIRSTTRESPESIATGLRTISSRLQRNRTITFLRQLGIELQTNEGQFVGVFEAFKRLSDGLQDIPTTDPRFASISEELGGFRQVGKLIPGIKNFAVAQQALNVIRREGNTLDRDAALAQETLAVRIAKVGQEFAALLRKFSETGTFRAFVDVTLRLASAFVKVADALIPLAPILASFAALKIGVLAGPLLGGFAGQSGLRSIAGKNAGGLIPGRGPNVDSVAATLTKGEFVLQRKAVDKVGISTLDKLNRGKFNKGGLVGFQRGGAVSGGGGLGGNNLLLLGAIALSTANSLFRTGDAATEAEKTINDLTSRVISAITQFAILNTILKAVNVQKVFSALSSKLSFSGFGGGGGGGDRFTSSAFGFGGRSAGPTLVNSRGSTVAGLGGVGSTPLVGGIVGINQRIASLAKVNQKLGQSATATGGEIKSATKAVLGFSVAVGVISGAVGGFLQDLGFKQIQAGEFQSGAGNVVTGATVRSVGIGAAAGFAVAGPLGAAAGALAGLTLESQIFTDTVNSLTGGMFDLKTAADKAREAIAKVQLERIAESTAKAEKRIEKTQLSSPQGQQAVRDFAKNIQTLGTRSQEQFRTVTRSVSIAGGVGAPGFAAQETSRVKVSEQTRDDFVKQLESEAPAFLKRFQEQARFTGKTSEETRVDLGLTTATLSSLLVSVGSDTITFGRALDRSTDAVKIFSKAQLDSLKQFETINKLETIIGSTERGLQGFSDQLSALKGEVSIPDFDSLFLSAAKGQLNQADTSKFKQITDNLGGRLGAGGRGLARQAQGEATAIRILPEVLKQVRKVGSFENETPEETFERIFDTALGNKQVGGTERGILNTALKEIIGRIKGSEGQQANLQKILKPENIQKILDQFASAANKAGPALQNLSKSTANSQKLLVGSIKQHAEAEKQVTESLNKGISIRAQREDTLSEARFSVTGRRISLGRRLGRTRQQFGNLLGGTGFNAASPISAIEAGLQQARQRRQTAQDALTAGTGGTAAANSVERQTTIVNKLTTAFEFLRDNTLDAAAIQKSLNVEQDKRKARLGLAEREAFGSSSERRELRREKESIGLVQRFGLGGVSTKTRQRFDAITSVAKDVAIFGGKTGQQLRNKALEREGLGGTGVTKESKAEQKLLKDLNNAFKQRETANTILAQIAANTTGRTGQQTKNIQKGFNSGGFIPGVGNSDSVDARLTPGEFIIRKESASLLGARFLNNLNKSSKKSTKGVGSGVRFQEGGLVSAFGNGGSVSLDGVGSFGIAISSFVSGVNTLSTSLDAFPREITGNFKHSIEVIFNGAEIMTRLMPEIQDIALSTAKSELRKFVNDKLPDIGPID